MWLLSSFIFTEIKSLVVHEKVKGHIKSLPTVQEMEFLHFPGYSKLQQGLQCNNISKQCVREVLYLCASVWDQSLLE